MKRGRYTPKRSLEALRQKWAAVNVNDPKLNDVGRVMAHAARNGPKHFEQVCRELVPELNRKNSLSPGANNG